MYNIMQKKRKFGALLHGLCSDFEETLAKFVQGVGKLDESESTGGTVEQRFSKKKRTTKKPRANSERDVAPEQRPMKRQRKSKMAEKIVIEDAETAESDEGSSDDIHLNDTDSDDDVRYIH